MRFYLRDATMASAGRGAATRAASASASRTAAIVGRASLPRRVAAKTRRAGATPRRGTTATPGGIRPWARRGRARRRRPRRARAGRTARALARAAPVRRSRPGHAGRPLLARPAEQAIFTIAFAAFALDERPRRRQLIGRAIAVAGLALIATDRASTAPLLPFVLVVGAAAAWGVSNLCTRIAQPPDGLALMVWASLVAPLPLLGLSFAFEGPRAIGDALGAVDLGGIAALAYIVGPSTLRLRGVDGAGAPLPGRGGRAVHAARAGLRDRRRRAHARRAALGGRAGGRRRRDRRPALRLARPQSQRAYGSVAPARAS
jgi:hypothetical protein